MKEKELKQKLKKIRESLANSNGNIPDSVSSELKALTSQIKQDSSDSAFKNIKKTLDSSEITSKLSQIQDSDVVSRTIDKTMNSLLDPFKVVFAREMSRYIDAISADKKLERKVPRTVPKNTIKKLEGGKFVPIATGQEGEELVINPEFKQMLASGYKPRDIKEREKIIKDLLPKPFEEGSTVDNPLIDFTVSLKNPKIGTSDSEFVLNSIGGTEPGKRVETITTTVPKYASIFIDSFTITQQELNSGLFKFTQTSDGTQLSFKGALKTNTETKNLLPAPPSNSSFGSLSNPNWKIIYTEQGNKFILDVINKYKYSKKSSLIPNTNSYRFVGPIDNNSLNQDALNKLNEINRGDKCNVNSSEELFEYLLNSKLDGKVDNRASNYSLTNKQKTDFSNKLKSDFKHIINSFVTDLFSSMTKNRLLETFKFDSPAGSGLDENDKSKSNILMLNLINFIPEPTEELKACGKTLHPLNLDEISKLMKIKFKSIGLQTFPKLECETDEEPKNPITEASIFGSSLMLIRLSVFEYILKNLFIFDELGYSQGIINAPIIKEYISLVVKKDLEDAGLYETIEQNIEENYQILVDEGLIKTEDEQVASIVNSSFINNRGYEHPSEKIKIVISAMFRKTINYVKNLLGVKEEQQRTEIDLLSNNSTYDLMNSKNYTSENNSLPLNIDVNNFISNNYSGFNRLMQKHKNSKSFLMLEKYIIDQNNSSEGKISFSEYSDRISKNTDTADLKFKIGVRLLTVLRTDITEDININDVERATSEKERVKKINDLGIKIYNFIRENENKFIYKDESSQSVKIKPSVVSSEKNYVFFDYNPFPGSSGRKMRLYNSLPIELHEMEVSGEDFKVFLNEEDRPINALNKYYDSVKKQITDELQKKVDYQLIVKKSLMSDKITNLLSFYSHSALSTEEIESLFSTSKSKIKQLISAGQNINNYAYQNENDLKGGAAAIYQKDFQNIGNPNGSGGIDILQFLITTPILILKGLCNVMDPNIAIASQIVNAAAAGLLFPKIEDNGNVSYPGDPFILPTALASMALLPVNLLPPGVGIGPPVTPIPGILFWALEPLLWKLPFFQNQAANSTAAKNIKNDPRFRGLNIGAGNFSCNKDQDDI